MSAFSRWVTGIGKAIRQLGVDSGRRARSKLLSALLEPRSLMDGQSRGVADRKLLTPLGGSQESVGVSAAGSTIFAF